jgi:hypothetical protein
MWMCLSAKEIIVACPSSFILSRALKKFIDLLEDWLCRIVIEVVAGSRMVDSI